ncbi:MAG: prepilin-type N-terminal cleavage/methylation domain-containing protein [Stellaceae bacterium]
MNRPSGFTLVELLLALALIGIVSLLATAGTRFAALGLDRTAVASERLATRRNLDDLLRRELASALVPPLLANQVPLEGTAHEVAFLSLAEDGGAGLFRTILRVESAGGTPALVLGRRRADADGRLERVVLVPRLRHFTLAYFGATAAGGEPAWQTQWHNMPYLPSLVRIEIGTEAAPQQAPLVIRLWTAP